MSDSTIQLLQDAKNRTIKDREDALRKAAEPFDRQILILDNALKELSKTSSASSLKSISKITKITDRDMLTTLQSSSSSKNIYPKDGTIANKLAFVIAEAGKFIHIAEIAERIKKHEQSGKPAPIKRRFSKHMDKYKRQGKIVTYSFKNKTFYGLPSFAKSGKPLEKFKPIKS